MLKRCTFFKSLFCGLLCFLTANCYITELRAQNNEKTTLHFSDFKGPAHLWKPAGEIVADYKKDNILVTAEGEGIIVNLPTKKKKSGNLITNFEHGDLDLEFDFMMPKGSNSGIYLQGRYEVQLMDSWGQKTPTSADNGAIYPRWDDQKPKGSQAYEGHAPRQNVTKAPGLWQTMKIAFQAPVFDASGKKIQNAKILTIDLNGVRIHEDVELFGPTRGAMGKEEVPRGPLLFQGDHGAVAFRNIKIRKYDGAKPVLSNLTSEIFKGDLQNLPDFSALELVRKEDKQGALLSNDFRFLGSRPFVAKYIGKIEIHETGSYHFNFNFSRGFGQLKINNDVLLPLRSGSSLRNIKLPEGNHDFELIYAKESDWGGPALSMSMFGPGFRETFLSDESGNIGYSTDPIYIDAPEVKIVRSFMNLPDTRNELFTSVYHAISVGNPENVHFTYDNDKGSLVQVWRGQFLDATPMWHERGNGSSRPMGSVLKLMPTDLTVSKLESINSPWAIDTLGAYFRPKGYELLENGTPVFKYEISGASVKDLISVWQDGKGFKRNIQVENNPNNLYVRLAEGNSIKAIDKETFVVDDKAYYIKLDDLKGSKPVIRDGKAGKKELIVPISSELVYSIIF